MSLLRERRHSLRACSCTDACAHDLVGSGGAATDPFADFSSLSAETAACAYAHLIVLRRALSAFRSRWRHHGRGRTRFPTQGRG